MCVTCGCGNTEEHAGELAHLHLHHEHGHTHHHPHHHHASVQGRMLTLEKDVLSENNLLAQRNRGYFDAKEMVAINLVSSPGSGKTALLERTLTDLKDELLFSVIEGDQHTSRDTDRIRATGTNAVQINTGKGCHLDAHQVLHALQELKPAQNSVLFIENVGNLVCPSMFDLGETDRVVIMSVTEGEDKPLKYPDMFHTSSVCVINKIDLLPYVPFDIQKAKEYALQVNPRLQFFVVSCTSGKGLTQLYEWLKQKVVALQASSTA